MKNLFSIFFLMLFIPSLAQVADSSFNKKLQSLYNFSVPLIQPKELHKLLHEGQSVILLDTRNEKEYHVSHLKNAQWVGYDSFSQQQVKDIPKNSIIVVYCSVGCRSEKIGEQLAQSGFTNVQNLYGGIFEWVNLGFPVYDKQGLLTNKIHAYSKEWSIWLKKGYKVYE